MRFRMIIILIFLFTFISTSIYAASGNSVFVTNQSFHRSTTLFATPTPSNYNLTDGDATSFAAMYASGLPYYFMTPAYSPLKRINGYKVVPHSNNAIVAASATFTIGFYNSTNTLITQITNISGVNVTDVDIPTVSGVSRVIINCNNDVDCRLAEYQIYEAPPDTTAPSVPGNFLVNELDGKLSLSWNASTDNIGIQHYEVYKNGTLLTTTTSTSADVLGVNGTDIEVKVRAVDTSDNKSSFTSAIVKYPKDNLPPYEPIGLTVVITDYQATLSWSEHTATDFRRYKLYRNLTLVHSTPIGSKTTTTYTFTGLTNQSNYSLGVAAEDTSFNLSNIATINAYIAGTPPPVPSNLALTAGNGLINATWDTVTATDLTGYNVYVNGTKRNTTPLTSNSLEISGLTNNIAYTVKITAIDDDGNESAYSIAKIASPRAPLDVNSIGNGTSIRIVITGGSAPFSYTVGSTSGSFYDMDYLVTGLTPMTDYLITVTDDTGAIYSSTVSSGVYSGIIAPSVPSITGTMNSALGSFTDGGNIAVTIASAAGALLIIILLSIWAWRLTKKRLTESQ
jgi:chitodextrinase